MQPFGSVLFHNPKVERLHFDELYHVDYATSIDSSDDDGGSGISGEGGGCQGSQLLPSVEGLRAVRDAFAASASKPPSPGKVIMVSRDKSSARSFLNQAEVNDVVKGIAERAGMQFVVYEGKDEPGSFEGAIETFRDARVVVGPHGGGLSNVVFSPANTVVMEVSLETEETGEYEYMSNALGLRYRNYTIFGGGLFEAKVQLNVGEGGEFRDFVKRGIAEALDWV